MRHRLSGISTYGLNGLGEGDDRAPRLSSIRSTGIMASLPFYHGMWEAHKRSGGWLI